MKFKELEPFGDCYNIRFGGTERSREAVLFLHGFPAEQGNKNIDLAEKISDEFKLDVYLLHYRGLGKSEGKYTFISAIEDAAAYAKKLINENGYSHLHLVGHSWGGWVATEVYRRIKDHRGRLVLLAPFTDINPTDGAMQMALYFMRHYPHIISSDKFDGTAAELQTIRNKYHAQKTASELTPNAGNVLIIHALKDDIIPKEMSLNLKKSWGPSVHYIEMDSDHRFFRNRDQMIKAVESFFKTRPSQI